MNRVIWIALLLAASGHGYGYAQEDGPPPTGPPVRFDFSGELALPVPEEEADILTGGPVRLDFSGTLAPPGSELQDITTGDPLRFDFSGTLALAGAPGSGSPDPGGPQPQSVGQAPPPAPGGAPSGQVGGGPSQPQQPPPPPPSASGPIGGENAPPNPANAPDVPPAPTQQPPPPPPAPGLTQPPTPQHVPKSQPNLPRSLGQVRLLSAEFRGACAKQGDMFKVQGSGFGNPGSHMLQIRAKGSRTMVPVQARRWTNAEIIGSIPAHPQIRPDNRTSYEFLITDRSGVIVSQMREPFKVCR